MSDCTITVDGEIKAIRFRYTRRGKPFAQARVRSNKIDIIVDFFSPSHVSKLRSMRPGDQLHASGPGFHRGSIRNGTTSITARRMRLKVNEAGRIKNTPPVQMEMFAA
jgi:hypothetical protein